jgi:hypothetical protein
MTEEREFDVSWSMYQYADNPITAIRQAQGDVAHGIEHGEGATVWVVRDTQSKEKWVIDMGGYAVPSIIQGPLVEGAESAWS